jgi:RimJ/RimL family protein N-acetyltransferase
MLQGKLIRLRKAEEKDLNRYYNWINDLELSRLILGTVTPCSQGQVRRIYDTCAQSPNQDLQFTIETLKEELIGLCFLRNIHPIHRMAEIEQFFIGEKKYRNNGYGRDAIEVLLEYCFTELNLNRIWLITYVYNQEAIRFYEKSGFSKEGLLRQIQFTKGEYHDGVILAILKKDWKCKFNQQKHLIPKGQTRLLLP